MSNEKDAKDILSFIFSRRLILCLLLSAERDGEPLENRRLRMNLTSPIYLWRRQSVLPAFFIIPVTKKKNDMAELNVEYLNNFYIYHWNSYFIFNFLHLYCTQSCRFVARGDFPINYERLDSIYIFDHKHHLLEMGIQVKKCKFNSV